ncbi:MAG: SagB/ThcOx family dehydrogenase [Bdellovibrionales bacterium]|nr:SagB/ThcOx family dehydrogenase [Bdellovibrionales bacterium]
MEDTDKIQTNPMTIIRPPSSFTGDHWQIEILNLGKKWKVQEPLVSCLMAAAGPIERGHLENQSGAAAVQTLLNMNLLVFAESVSAVKHPSLNPDVWAAHDAAAAGDYHRATFDHPFMDYSPGGTGADLARQRMVKYSATAKDDKRFKEVRGEYEINLHSPSEIVLSKDGDFLSRFHDVLSMTFLPIGSKSIPWSDVPLLRRTSPSGGSRHPIEAYVHLADSSLFHCNIGRGVLTRIGSLEAKLQSGARVYLTCVFERNSYRYREPRTFRSVHMDAGHLAGTFDICAAACGLATRELNSLDEDVLNSALHIDGFEEFLIGAFEVCEEEGQ